MDFHPFSDRIDPERDFMKPETVAETVLQCLTTPADYGVPEVVIQPLIPR